MVTDGITGFLVPAGDPDALTRAVEAGLSTSGFDRTRMRQLVETDYSLERIAIRLYRIYQEQVRPWGQAVPSPA